MSAPKFRVAICGGGIGGLALAFVLTKYAHDVKVDIYEAAAQFTTVGAGISVWRRTWSIMKLLGLDVALGELAIRPPQETPQPGFVFRKSDQTEEGVDFYQMVSPYGAITLHRADMLKVLTDSLPQTVTAHFSKKLVHYATNPSGTIRLQFNDGTEAETDLLVGADGIKSVTRATLYCREAERAGTAEESEKLLNFVEPSWTGIFAYRGLVEKERVLALQPAHRSTVVPLVYFGKDKHVVSYPISQGRLVNFAAFVTVPGGEGTKLEGPSVQNVPKEEMVNHFHGWEPDVQTLLQSADAPSRWAINVVRGLPFYVKGAVALLGDAAHAMTPHQGAGAGQAIEDAYILGRLLSHPNVDRNNITSALKVYDGIRRPFAHDVVEGSRTTGFIYEFSQPGLDCERGDFSMSSLKATADEAYKKWSWHWQNLPEDDWVQAERELQEMLSLEDK